ncbi:MAG: molybdopterin synthase sulfur carrier subunit [Acidimicrobiia bacterium]
MPKVRIPTPLRTLTGGVAEVEVPGTTVKEALDNLEKNHPGMAQRIYDDSGELRRFVNVYVDDEDIRFVDGLSTSLREDSVISIVPAVAGGG